jgi:hypothetical protein
MLSVVMFISFVQVGMKVVMMSPGFVYEPYSPRERIPFWKRFFFQLYILTMCDSP